MPSVLTVFITLSLLAIAFYFFYLYDNYLKAVPKDHIGFDGEHTYQPGRYILKTNTWHLIHLAERTTIVGLHYLEPEEHISRTKTESGFEESIYFKRTGKTTSEDEIVRRKPKKKTSLVVVWKPDPQNLTPFIKLNEALISSKIESLYQTIPNLNIRQYQRQLGILICRIDRGVPESPPKGLILGEDTVVPDSARSRHVYVIGMPGSGKSTLLLNSVLQDIESGKGVGVIDPHGDLADQILYHIPNHRAGDVYYLDPLTSPLGIDFFSAKDDEEAELIADDTVVLFKRLTDSWGERMDAIVRYMIRALISYPGTTFLDIHRFLTDDRFRFEILTKSSGVILDFWKSIYPTYPKGSEQPIVSRMGKFVSSKALSRIVGTISPVSFYDIMQGKKIFIARIPQGEIGSDTSKILGSLLVSQLQLAATRRTKLPPEKRVPFHLYIDEFQNFKTSAFSVILTESRKYQLCLTMAHQFLSQLDPETKTAVINTTGTGVYFRLGDEDSAYFSKKLLVDDLRTLPVHLAGNTTPQAYLRGLDGEVIRFEPLPPPSGGNKDNRDLIIEVQKRFSPEEPPLYFDRNEDDDVRPGKIPS